MLLYTPSNIYTNCQKKLGFDKETLKPTKKTIFKSTDFLICLDNDSELTRQ